MPEPTVATGMIGLVDYFNSNPILYVLLGLGWIGIIIYHFKIHWRIQTHFHHNKTLKSLTDAEIKEDYERHLRVQEEMKLKHPNYVYFRKGEWSDKIRQEFFKRHLDLVANNEATE